MNMLRRARGPGFLVVANIFFCAATAIASPTVKIGFQNSADLFTCTPGDTVRLEELGAVKAMRWDIKYVKNQYRSCRKDFKPGTVTGMDEMRFKMRSDTAGALWLQVEEVNGEAFYKIITPGSTWKSVSLQLADLTLNEDTVRNGRLDVDQISKIHVLDATALEGGSTGRRIIWFSDWEFAVKGTVRENEEVIKSESQNIIPVKKLSTGKVGISAIPLNWQDTQENWLKVFTKAREVGAQILSGGNIEWGEETEPSPGVYKWSSMEKFFSVLEKHGFDFEFSSDMGGVFFHDKIHSPKDIEFKSFMDPVFLSRYHGWMSDFLKRFGSKVTYIVIHAEGAYSYFNKHPEQIDDYCRFIKTVRALIKRKSPHIQVGVNADHLCKDGLLSRMAKVVDFMGYDIMKSDKVKIPSDLEGEIKRLIRLADGKKIAIQNGGWSTSKVEESSDKQQMEFIREFYRVLFKYREEIEYASFYTVYDDDTSITGPIYRGMFPDYPDYFVDKMVESNGRFGVFRHDGTPKPGLYELKKQVAAYYVSH